MTWAPGKPMLIKNRLISDGGWIERPGCTVFNLYRPPSIVPKAGDVAPWLDLCSKVFPNEAEHIVRVAGAPRAAAAGKDQPRARARRRARHRQGHDPGAGQAGDRPLELRRRVAEASARPLQRLPQVGDPARQRGARPWRIRPLRLPRPHEGLHRRAARRAARR